MGFLLDYLISVFVFSILICAIVNRDYDTEDNIFSHVLLICLRNFNFYSRVDVSNFFELEIYILLSYHLRVESIYFSLLFHDLLELLNVLCLVIEMIWYRYMQVAYLSFLVSYSFLFRHTRLVLNE